MSPFKRFTYHRAAYRKGRGTAGFTLIELLVVIAIIALLTIVAVPALRTSSAGKFSSSLQQIAGILDQARAYATGQNTYVWVAFYPLDPSTLTAPDTDLSGEQLYVVTYASTDGTDPVNWADNTFQIPYPANTTPASIVQLSKVKVFKQLHLETVNYFTSGDIPSMPTAMENPEAPNTASIFSLRLKSPILVLSQQTPPTGEQKSYVVGFSPTGSATQSASLAAEIGLDLQPMNGPGVKDTNNIAALRISGLVGLTTIYRK